jgi:proteic killer suppression protein
VLGGKRRFSRPGDTISEWNPILSAHLCSNLLLRGKGNVIPRRQFALAYREARRVTSGISLGYEGLAIRISMRYVLPVIRSFKGKFAELILQGRMVPKGFPANLAKVARRKLIMVDSVDLLEALNSPPGNRLEALKGDLTGKHSIRINDQWRVVFRWTDAGPEDVEIVDYH